MGQEFFINSQNLENKIRDLLPSQGGAGAGFDLSASTQIIPVIDVTESAEGSDFRQDLQTSLSLKSQTVFSLTNASGTIINQTGFLRVDFIYFANSSNTGSNSNCTISLTDGTTTKIIYNFLSGGDDTNSIPITTNIFLDAGETVIANAGAGCNLNGSFRQIADIAGNLTNP